MAKRKKQTKKKQTKSRGKAAVASKVAAGPDLKSAVELVEQLMGIVGPSGKEATVAKFVTEKLRKAGAKPAWITTDAANKKTPLAGDTGNLILKLPGKARESRRMLVSHMDTVPVCVGSQPVRRGNFFRSADSNTGLGADNRAGVAVILQTALDVLRNKPDHPPLTFLWTIQEEIGLHGARLLDLKKLSAPKMAFNWDGGGPAKLTIGATGGYRMKIHIRGLASHAGNAPERGVSAIAIASLAIADLHRNGWHGDIRKSGKRGTSNVGVIQGGAATNVVTDAVELAAEARSHNSVFRKRIVREIETAFRKAVAEVKSSEGKVGKVKFDGRLDYESFALSPKEPCVVSASNAIESVGLEPVMSIANGGLDANWLSARGISTVTMGCGQLNQHMTTEALNVKQFEAACRIAYELAVPNG